MSCDTTATIRPKQIARDFMGRNLLSWGVARARSSPRPIHRRPSESIPFGGADHTRPAVAAVPLPTRWDHALSAEGIKPRRTRIRPADGGIEKSWRDGRNPPGWRRGERGRGCAGSAGDRGAIRRFQRIARDAEFDRRLRPASTDPVETRRRAYPGGGWSARRRRRGEAARSRAAAAPAPAARSREQGGEARSGPGEVVG